MAKFHFIVFCLFIFSFSIVDKAYSQATCSTALALTVGANDTVCNSQHFNSLGSDLDNASPPTTSLTGGNTCGAAISHAASWYSFTGDGTTVRVKIFGQNQTSRFLVFKDAVCGGAMTPIQCANFPNDDLPHTLDINTINGSVYKIAVLRQTGSATMQGDICAYKPLGILPKGTNCAFPYNITLPVSFTNQTSCGKGAYYSLTCGNAGTSSSAQDVVYSFTATTTGCVAVSVSNFNATSLTKGFSSSLLETACPGQAGSVCVGRSERDYPQSKALSYRGSVVAGKTYYIIVDVGHTSNDTECATSFNLDVAYDKCPPPPLTGAEMGADCGSNLGFEAGDVSNWTGRYNDENSNYTSLPINPPIVGFKPSPVSVNGAIGACAQTGNNNTATPRHTITSGAGTDPNAPLLPVLAPGGGNYSFRLGNQEPDRGAECIKSTFVPTAAKPIFTYLYAIVTNDAIFHPDNAKSRFDVSLKDPGGVIIPCGGQYTITSGFREGDGFYPAGAGACGGANTYYSPWVAVSVDLTPYIGQTLTLEFCNSDCTGGGHFSYAYIDAYCNSNKIEGTTLCTTGGNITLTAPPGFTNYKWYNGGYPVSGAVIGSNQTISVAPTSGSIYTVTYENYQGVCALALHATDTVKVFTATAGGSATLCNNASGTHQLTTTTNDATATYTWSPATNLSCTNCPNPTITLPLAATTTYTVTMTSPGGCSITSTVPITVQACGPSVVATGEKICPGACASITAVGSNGTSPYTYSWTGGLSGATQSLCPLTTTTYTITVSDANGSTGINTVTVTINPTITGTTTVVNAKCSTSDDGSATVTAGGGTPGYVYTWSTPPGGNSATTPSTLAPGMYTVTITDSFGCTISTTAVITPPPPVAPTATSTPANCGASDGTATADATGGTGSTYTYTWANPPGGTTKTISGLGNGTYTVTVTDVNNCSASTTVTVSSTGGVTLNLQGFNNTTCAAPGNATVAAVGGTPDYTYTWSAGSVGNTSVATSLIAGNYTITVTDATGCISTTSVTITSPASPTLTTGKVDDKCDKSIGSVTATPNGGLTPYTYQWDDPNLSTTSTVNNLLARDYAVTVTDANACTVTTVVTVGNLSAPTAITTPTNITCFGANDGKAEVVANGGAGSFTYTWLPGGETTSSITNLAQGDYTVTVTDAVGCTVVNTITITEPTQITIAPTVTDAKCDMSNGSISVITNGGTGTLTPTWSPSTLTGLNPTGLAASTYTITVTDGTNCSTSTTITVNGTSAVSLNLQSSTDATCSTPGNATVSATGGTAPFTYTWSAGSVGNTDNATSLIAGDYAITVSDVIGCTSTTSVTITSPPSPTLTTGNVDDNCGKSIGSVTVTANGGLTPYTYQWDDPSLSTTATVSNLLAGNYAVTVTDANACTATSVVTVNDLNGPTAIASSTNITCFGANDGTANVVANGGAGNYTYTWQSGGETASSISNLAKGDYTVTVTDAAGCIVIKTVSVTEPPQITITPTVTDANCKTSNGSISITTNGGVGVLTPTWSPATLTGLNPTGLGAGSYTVTITDATSCTASSGVLVSNIGAPTLTVGSITNVSCKGKNDGNASITLAGGSTPYTITWNPTSVGTGTSITNLIAGIYTVVVSDALNCIVGTTITITEPPLLTISLPAIPDACIGQTTVVTATAQGGAPDYTYTWSDSGGVGATLTQNPIISTAYTVTVVDANGCTNSTAQTVNVKPQLQVDAGLDQNVCLGANATLTAVAVGGNGNYTYVWDPGSLPGNTITVTPTAVQVYTVTVTDDCGTPAATDVVTVTPVLPLLTPDFTPDSTSGCAPLCVTFGNTSTGGTTLGCNWDFGNSVVSNNCAPTNCYRTPGLYSVSLTVTDQNGCLSSVTKNNIIRVYPLPIAAFKANPKSTSILEPTISFTDESSTTAVKWDWNFGDTYNSSSTKKNPTHTYKDTGKYAVQLIITTPYGCKDTVEDVVIIHGDYMFYVPNAFSPNDDGKNETFFPKGYMIREECYKMYIFDRWGNLIFETTNLQIGWDGKANGGAEISQQDVYVWKIETCDYEHKKHKYIGHVTLVR